MKNFRIARRATAHCLAGALCASLIGACNPLPKDFKIPEINPPRPDVSPEVTAPGVLAPPAGNRLALVLVASGSQNYECRRSAEVYQWEFTGPEARLYSLDDHLVGKHYAGPTWEFKDGSKVTGHVIAQAPSANQASVAQLLLHAETSSAEGTLAGVTYIQRLHTVGGVAPPDPCGAAQVGDVRQVLYSAHYAFFKAS